MQANEMKSYKRSTESQKWDEKEALEGKQVWGEVVGSIAKTWSSFNNPQNVL